MRPASPSLPPLRSRPSKGENHRETIMRFLILVREPNGALSSSGRHTSLREARASAEALANANPGCAVYIYDKRSGGASASD
mgnify:CR=1 FL=1